MTLEAFLAAAGVVAHVGVVGAVGLRVIWVRRPAGSAYAWLLLVVVLPLVGLVLYLLFGERPIGRKRLRRANAFYATFPAEVNPLWALDVADPAGLSPAERGLSNLALRAAGLPLLRGSTLALHGGARCAVPRAARRAGQQGVHEDRLAEAPARGRHPAGNRAGGRPARPGVQARRLAAAPQDRRRRWAHRLHRQHEPGRSALLQAGRGRRRLGRCDGAHRGAGGGRIARGVPVRLEPADRRAVRGFEPGRVHGAARGRRAGTGAGGPVRAGGGHLGQPAHPGRCRRHGLPAHRADDAVLRARPGARAGIAERGDARCRGDDHPAGGERLDARHLRQPRFLWRTARRGRPDSEVRRRPAAHQERDHRRPFLALRHREPRHAQPAPELRADAGGVRPGLQRGAAGAAARLCRCRESAGRRRVARAAGARVAAEGAASPVAPML